jgi:sucrose-6F-phosphate phosphohydrolase
MLNTTIALNSFLFVTDLDNTLVGDAQALAELNQTLEQHRQQAGTKIVYATGRSRQLYEELRSEQSLLEPDALVLSVGTLIYNNGSSTPDPNWAERLNQNWNLEQVQSIAAKFQQMTPQAQSEQGSFKASYYLEGDDAETVLPQLKRELLANGLQVELVYSSKMDLDILPREGNKGTAMLFLQERFNMTKPQTVVCGDSGNDLSMFMTQRSRGIIVGNAQPELLHWHHENPSSDRYLAQSHCAGGILEGLHHFGFLS